MQTRRVNEIPWHSMIVTIVFINKTILTMKTPKGQIEIKTPKAMRGLKQGDRLRVEKVLLKGPVKRANGNPYAVNKNAFSLREWKQNGNYTTIDKNGNIRQYVSYQKVLDNWKGYEIYE